MKKIMTTVAVVATMAFGATACQSLDSAAKDHPYTAKAQNHKAGTKQADSKPAGPKLTMAQQQAVGTAQDYLATQAFSKPGLVDQLKFEGYKLPDAVFAVNHIKVNWNEQATKSAKEYLNGQHFSRQGLIDQLRFEKFTPAQAVYGVNHTGL